MPKRSRRFVSTHAPSALESELSSYTSLALAAGRAGVPAFPAGGCVATRPAAASTPQHHAVTGVPPDGRGRRAAVGSACRRRSRCASLRSCYRFASLRWRPLHPPPPLPSARSTGVGAGGGGSPAECVPPPPGTHTHTHTNRRRPWCQGQRHILVRSLVPGNGIAVSPLAGRWDPPPPPPPPPTSVCVYAACRCTMRRLSAEAASPPAGELTPGRSGRAEYRSQERLRRTAAAAAGSSEALPGTAVEIATVVETLAIAPDLLNQTAVALPDHRALLQQTAVA